MPKATPELQKEYQRQWIASRRADYFSDKCCEICGSDDRLELDHILPATKKYNPASLWGMALDNPDRIDELAKCQVLCYPHHKEKTKFEEFKTRTHGRGLYRHGCRCDICVEAKRLSNAKRYTKAR